MTPTEIRAYCRRRRYSREYADYWAAHTVCEACKSSPSGPPHHIRSRGAHGNVDEPWNLIALCIWDHTRAHTWGRALFAEFYSAVADKIRAAWERTIP